MGDFALGWLDISPGPRLYDTQLSIARKVLTGLKCGVDAFNRWSFVNRGDLDGQFQLVRTWDMSRREYLRRVEPEPVPYCAYGPLTRLQAKHSEVLKVTVPEDTGLLAAALRSPTGHQTVYLLNLEASDRAVSLSLHGVTTERAWFQYQVEERNLAKPGFRLAPKTLTTRPSTEAWTAELTLPPRSLTALSTYHLSPDAPGVLAD
jgi:hypothetical protein